MAYFLRLSFSLIFLILQTEVLNSQIIRNGEAFDFIVVGGGTGGCTVARRLAESGEHKVLLIEAGGVPNPNLEIPALASNYFSDPNSVKVYETVPQENAGRALGNGTIRYIAARMLGGGSGINMMFLNRGSPHDYDNWAKLTGDNSWSYQSLLKYFRKMEDYHGANPTEQRGHQGPISVTPHHYAPGLYEWLKGGLELGYHIADPNGPQIESFTQVEFAHRNGKRVSAYKGYIEPLLNSNNQLSLQTSFKKGTNPANLLILVHTEVNRIIFEDNRAVGVKFTTRNNSTGESVVRFATANKEIIVSAGTVESAALLMKSGIGPRSVLNAANIHPIKYLPVGQNLHDHPGCSNVIIFGNTSAVLDLTRDLTPETWSLFERTGDGPYSSATGGGAQAFLTSSALPVEEKLIGWPDIHLYAFNSNAPRFRLSQSSPNLDDLKEWETAVVWKSLVSRPKSRGSVTLNYDDIDSQPVIDYRYLTHPDDMQVMVDAIKIVAKLCESTHALQRVGCRLPTNLVEGCTHLKFRSDSYWKCHARQFTTTTYHPAGTCRMGKSSEDSEAVVDTQLRVIGVDGLRVADASVMPTVTNANTMAPVYIIGEKAADMILNEWKQKLNSKFYI